TLARGFLLLPYTTLFRSSSFSQPWPLTSSDWIADSYHTPTPGSTFVITRRPLPIFSPFQLKVAPTPLSGPEYSTCSVGSTLRISAVAHCSHSLKEAIRGYSWTAGARITSERSASHSLGS